MIIGTGDIASALADVKHGEDILFFASGVSDSSTRDMAEFNREQSLLLSMPRGMHLVYFSSLSIYHSTSMYAEHKFAMENVVRDNFDSHTIVRIGNIAWGSNPHTIINHMRHRLSSGLQLTIRNEYRFVVDRSRFVSTMSYVVWKRPAEINIHGERLTVAQIVSRIKDKAL